MHKVREAWTRNIVFRLGAGIILAVTLSTGVYTTYVMQSLRAEASTRLQERVDRLASVLSHALARPLFDINSAAVSSVVDALGATPEVLMLRVLSPNGTVLASLGSMERDLGTAIREERAITYTDGNRTFPVGSIELAFSRQQIDQDLQRQIVTTATANALLTLAIVGIIFLVGRKVSRHPGRARKARARRNRYCALGHRSQGPGGHALAGRAQFPRHAHTPAQGGTGHHGPAR
jgi:hypothetical protein